jgi:peptidoglycan/xylan/chitin deacetylase (PgdA/CDA1 family)
MRAILTYHSIDESGSPISVSPDDFEKQVAWLSSGRVQVTTLDRLLSLPDNEDAVAVTFDDGFVNFTETAAPQFAAHGLPVTVFVVSGHAGGTNAWNGQVDSRVPHLTLLGWPALRRLTEQGITLGAHTRTHCDLTQLSAEQLEDELRSSADAIERETGVRPDAFAYPYGRFNPEVSRAVARTFRYGCTTEFETLGMGANSFELPRLDMWYFRGARRLDQWGTPAFARYVKLRNQMRHVRQFVTAW